jgi:alkaline phosphatase
LAGDPFVASHTLRTFLRAGVGASLAAALFAGAAASQTAVQSSDPYFRNGEQALQRALAVQPNTGRAKNVILFVGDGMGVSTVTASRIYEGQSRGVDGESNSLAFERLPYGALSKTYSHDTQVTDSAAGISALTTGVKTRNKVIALTGAAIPENCASESGARVATIAELAEAAGKSTGAVTTTRITHATPAGTYAHSAYRDWEGDSDMPAEARKGGCRDIASQLVASRLDVALGGGRSRFLPQGAGGARADGRDLTREWLKAPRSAYVTDEAGLMQLDAGKVDRLLGLFAPEHLPYEVERAQLGQGVPTLAEMATRAVDVLSKNPNGYFLLVEGGKIDMGSHLNNARRTLTEAVEFNKAFEAVMRKVDLKDTLVIVTADHSHGLVISGYAARNAPILGLAGNEGEPVVGGDGKAYTTIMFATGPGGPEGEGTRADPAKSDLDDVDYVQNAAVHLKGAAHGGEDVPIYAGGPQAHLFRGVVEESYVFQVMRHAMGLDAAPAEKSSGITIPFIKKPANSTN